MTVTIINKSNGVERLHGEEMAQVVDNVRGGAFRDVVDRYRTVLPAIRIEPGDEDAVCYDVEAAAKIPLVCFAAMFKNHRGQREMVEYNGLVMLETCGLADFETACKVRDMASLVPYTMLAFVGATGCDVKIVCRIAPFDGILPRKVDDATALHTAAFGRLHYLYSSDLQMDMVNVEPKLDDRCMLSDDKEAFFNPLAEPLHIDVGEQTVQRVPMKKDKADDNVLPGMNKEQTMMHVFEACLAKALDMIMLEPADNETYALASMLARYCHESGVPEAVAMGMCRYKSWYHDNEITVKMIFNNEYNRKMVTANITRHISGSQLLMMKTENFMRSHYELRKNVLTGVAQYRDCSSYYYGWRDITDDVRNTMTITALHEGIDSWDKDISRFLNSTLVKQYDPLAEWLGKLPKWDGKDRVSALAKRVPTDDGMWEYSLHTWMLSMVAHWLGHDTAHGNAIVPLLIGYQGCGKTTFCSQLLPRELRTYYSDSLNLKNETTLLLALSSYALINIDEFDKITKSQQPVLKYIVSKSDVKLRVPYGQAMEERRRYASFIATTNNTQPLIDQTGSRRFVCTKVTGQIDTETEINYNQLYAQLMSEIDEGKRYWFDEEETKQVVESNNQFRSVEGLDELLLSVFRHPKPNEPVVALNITEIINVMKRRLPGFKFDENMAKKIGRALVRLGFSGHRLTSGMIYQIIEKS